LTIVKPKKSAAPAIKPLEFLGSSTDDLVAMPAGVRHDLGVELMRVQFGGQPTDFKPMSAVYVLHAFQKKTQRTANADIELAKVRYKMIRGKP
jgi:phage-related protein